MTAVFRHTAGDTIFIDDGMGNVLDNIPLATFLQLEPAYLITDGTFNPSLNYKYKEYIPAVKHYLITNDGNFGLGEVPWADGDTYISKIVDYEDIIDNPTQDLTIAKNIKLGALTSYYSAKIADGGIDLFSTTMPSNTLYAAETEAYSRQTDVPSGFYLKDTGGDPVTLTLTDLQTYEGALLEMRWAHRPVYDSHYSTIQAFTDIEDVNSYDFTGGWPALPFVPS